MKCRGIEEKLEIFFFWGGRGSVKNWGFRGGMMVFLEKGVSVGFWSRNRRKVGKSREFDDFWKIGKNREK